MMHTVMQQSTKKKAQMKKQSRTLSSLYSTYNEGDRSTPLAIARTIFQVDILWRASKHSFDCEIDPYAVEMQCTSLQPTVS